MISHHAIVKICDKSCSENIFMHVLTNPIVIITFEFNLKSNNYFTFNNICFQRQIEPFNNLLPYVFYSIHFRFTDGVTVIFLKEVNFI
jgi:hypothetical protein